MNKVNSSLNPKIWAFDYLGLITCRDLLTRLVSAVARDRKDLTVLDVGCGSSPWKPLFEGTMKHYDGLDIKEGPSVRFVASAEAMPVPNTSYDVVFSISSVEHIGNAQAALLEIWRVLKPGGVAIIGVPFIWEIHGEPHDYRRWTPWGLKHDLQKFKDVQVHQTGNAYTHFLLLQNLFVRRIQLTLYPVRWILSPLIVLNNLLGLTARLLGERPTAFSTFYIAVARKS